MTISRRTLILGVGSTAIGAAAAGGLLLARDPETVSQLDLLAARADDFRPHIGSTFRVTAPSTPRVDLQLAAVESRAADGITDTFMLRFEAADPFTIGQTTVGLRHRSLGTFDLFLVQGTDRTASALISHLL